MSGSEPAFTEVPKNGHDMNEGDRLRWRPDVDMRIDDGGESLTEKQKPRSRKAIDMEFARRAIHHHIHHAWKTTLYRPPNGISRKMRQSLKKYECDMAEEEAALQYYKKMDSAASWSCFVQVGLLGSQIVHQMGWW